MTVLLGALRPRSQSAHFHFSCPASGRPPQTAAPCAAPPEAAAAGEGGQHPLAEALVHETVNDGVDAG